MDKKRQATFITDVQDVDCQLYDGFFNEADKNAMSVIRAADKTEIGSIDMTFKDDRLNKLLPLYKARNYLKSISDEERAIWENYRYQKLMGGGAKSELNRYFMRLSELAKRTNLTSNDQYLLEELHLYGESILPEPIDHDDE